MICTLKKKLLGPCPFLHLRLCADFNRLTTNHFLSFKACNVSCSWLADGWIDPPFDHPPSTRPTSPASPGLGIFDATGWGEYFWCSIHSLLMCRLKCVVRIDRCKLWQTLLVGGGRLFFRRNFSILHLMGLTYCWGAFILSFLWKGEELENTLLVMGRGTYCWEVIRSGEGGSLLSEKRRTIEHLLLECWKPGQWCILRINSQTSIEREDINAYLSC